MKLYILAVALAAVQAVAGHTVFTTFFVDDINQGDGTCVRMPMTPNNATDPVNDLASDDMACGYDGTKGVARVCSVNQSSKLSFLFREYADGSQPGAIDPVHRGPCSVYMKMVGSSINDTAIGDGWFKIWDDGYDSTTSKWCTEKLMANNGFISVDLPNDLAGGYYLVRPELLALHQADKTPPNPQFYVGCAQIFLNSTATKMPADTIKIPGYVNIKDPSVLFNIWTPIFPYPMVGPAPYQNGTSPTIHMDPLTTQGEGLLPKDAIATNANWWGMELDSYTTEDGCWNASKACYAQAGNCYDTAPPTGSLGCNTWEARCATIQAACNNNNFNGPPNKGAQLSIPAQKSYSIPPAAQQTGYPQSGSSRQTQLSSTSITRKPPHSHSLSSSPTAPQSTTSRTPWNASVISNSQTGLSQIESSLLSNFGQPTMSQAYYPITPLAHVMSTVIVLTTTTLPSFGIGDMSVTISSSSDSSNIIMTMAAATSNTPTNSTFTIMNQVSSGSPSTVIFSTITPLSSDVPSYVNGTSVLMTGLPQSISTSMNAMCGPATGQTCLGSTYGPCCSKSGWCGNDDSYCGFGCQESWGTCGKQITEPGRKLIKHRHHGRRRG